MMLQLVRNGPLSVSFEVYDDFLHYKGGIYHHTGQSTQSGSCISAHFVNNFVELNFI